MKRFLLFALFLSNLFTAKVEHFLLGTIHTMGDSHSRFCFSSTGENVWKKCSQFIYKEGEVRYLVNIN